MPGVAADQAQRTDRPVEGQGAEVRDIADGEEAAAGGGILDVAVEDDPVAGGGAGLADVFLDLDRADAVIPGAVELRDVAVVHLERAAGARTLVDDDVEAVAGITVIIRPPKCESDRTIYLPDELVAILAEHVRKHTPDGEPSRWLFGKDGKPWHDNLVDYRWRSTRTDAGVALKLYELRHYFARGLIAAGCDIVTVQRAMRHASATTALSTYAHLWPPSRTRPGQPHRVWQPQYSPRA